MNELVFCTTNKNKLLEAKTIAEKKGLLISSLSSLNYSSLKEPEETGNTFKENAFQKATYYYQNLKKPCFSEDSGIEVPTLGEASPGVFSARYSGIEKDDVANNEKLLHNLQGGKRQVCAIYCSNMPCSFS